MKLTFISTSIIFSLIIFLFYIYKVKKKNKYKNIIFLLIFTFYNICNGVLYSSDINTFFILYVIILIFSFRLFIKNGNFSKSLISSFSLMIILTMVLGIFNLLILMKYMLIIYVMYNICFIFYNRKKLNVSNKLNEFFSKELLIFTILFIISIIGGIGRFIHIYDEYSHWAYDAKAVIYYNKLSTSKEIMSQTRSYAPVITCWHYIVAQFSSFSEQNLYIGLSIFISIYLMSVIEIKKNNNYSYLAIFIAYASCFIFGGVYHFNNLYADLAFGTVFGSSLINYFIYKENKSNRNTLIINLIILTLIKPSGCTASFAVLLYILLDKLFNEKNNLKIKIINFIKEYWKVIIAVILCFLIWNIYVKICDSSNKVFYDADIRPWTLKTDLIKKLNYNFILNFIIKIFASLDDVLIYNTFNITTYQFLAILFCFASALIYNLKQKMNILLNMIFTYTIFFCLTALSIFVSFSYYETSIIASFGRYLNSIHLAIVLLLIYFILKNIDKKNVKIIGLFFGLFILLSTSFKNITYFLTDISERKETHQTYNERNDKFKDVLENTDEDSKIFVIDQQDKDGIMAMWYARYYLFPRKVNASSKAITWKIKTNSNIDDLQDWGLTKDSFKEILIQYDFDYVYFYTSDKDIVDLLEIDNKKMLYSINKNGELSASE